jgi:hypothetical protein
LTALNQHCGIVPAHATTTQQEETEDGGTDRQTAAGRTSSSRDMRESILVDVSDLMNKSKFLIHEREERAKERRKDRDQGNHIQTGITKKLIRQKYHPLSVPHPSESSDSGYEIVQSLIGAKGNSGHQRYDDRY